MDLDHKLKWGHEDTESEKTLNWCGIGPILRLVICLTLPGFLGLWLYTWLLDLSLTQYLVPVGYATGTMALLVPIICVMFYCDILEVIARTYFMTSTWYMCEKLLSSFWEAYAMSSDVLSIVITSAIEAWSSVLIVTLSVVLPLRGLRISSRRQVLWCAALAGVFYAVSWCTYSYFLELKLADSTLKRRLLISDETTLNRSTSMLDEATLTEITLEDPTLASRDFPESPPPPYEASTSLSSPLPETSNILKVLVQFLWTAIIYASVGIMTGECIVRAHLAKTPSARSAYTVCVLLVGFTLFWSYSVLGAVVRLDSKMIQSTGVLLGLVYVATAGFAVYRSNP